MKYVYLILNWAFGILFAVMALVVMFKTPLAVFPLILISLLLLPPSRDFFFKKTNKELSTQTRAFLIVVLFVGFGTLVNIGEEDRRKELALQKAQVEAEKLAQQKAENIKFFNENRQKIIANIDDLIKNRKFNAATELAYKYKVANDDELSKIYLKAKTQKLLADLKKTPSDQLIRNREIYKELSSLNPANKKYKSKLNYYIKKISEKEEKELLAKERKEKIKRQFSAWDGSHYSLEKLIKKSMNDPGSYEHVETVYWDRGDHLIVNTTFRGKNAFGGVVKNTVKAKVALDGAIVQVLEQY